MSRQMRSQMPQVQKKKFDRNACLLVFTLIFVGILIFSLLTASDNKKLNRTLNETFDFVKTRIESYEIYNTNDQVKSLVRLMDKTTELSRVIAQEGNFRAEMLDKYAKEQRLTGILVLDKKLKVIEQTTRDGDAMPLWQKLIESDYVRDIVEHPEKTYTTRLRNEGKLYDFVAVARQDASGILIAYEQKEEVNEINGDLTMASLFSNFPFEMNGCVAICDEDKIVSTNKQNLVSSSVEGAKSLYENEFKSGGNGIVHLRSKNGNWYGRQEKIKDYNAYVFFPKHQVYITRNTICVIYALLALLIFLFYRVLRNRTEKRSILQDQKRLRVINALGHAYSSISLVNLKTEEIEIVKSSKDMKPDQQGDILSKAHLEELIQQVIAEPFQKAYWEFVDMSTVAKRLEDMGVESIDYLMITHFDRDHAGGAAQIIHDFDVKALLRPEYMKESDESAECMAAAEDRGVKVIIITSQTDIQLGSTKLVIHPADKVYENDASNNSSLVTEVFHGNNSLLFTGDIEKERIADIKYELNDAGYDFLKVPHHGRYEKILPEFFSLVGAQSAVITSSEKNPEEQETIQALEDAGVKDILLTRGGEITLQSDGRKLDFTQK